MAATSIRAEITLKRFERSFPTMGTTFRTVLYATDSKLAKSAFDAVDRRLTALNAALSDYIATSEVSRLSDSSGSPAWRLLNPDLEAVLACGQSLAIQTGGAFDMTVGPLTRLWRTARRHGKLPSASRLTKALEATGHDYLQLDQARHRAKLLRPNMRLDLGGIAKGYGVDEALTTLQAHGIKTALVDGGGDLRVLGQPPGTDGWRIGTQELDSATASATRLVREGAVATSGDLYQSISIDGREFSHLINPQTGLGLEFRRTVSVTAPTGMIADALASALSVLPTGTSRSLLSKHYPQAGARILTQQGAAIEETVIHPARSK